MNGDLLTTLDYAELVRDAPADAARPPPSAVCRREVKIDFGVIEASEASALERYIEKPVYHFNVSMGINVLNTSAVRPHLKPGQPLDLPSLMMRLRDAGHLVYCFREPCYWLDIGRIDDYQAATEVFELRRAEFLPESA